MDSRIDEILDVLIAENTQSNRAGSGKKAARTQILNLIEEVLRKCLPEDHWNTDVPSDQLNAQENGEVIGWNNCLDETKANLKRALKEDP